MDEEIKHHRGGFKMTKAKETIRYKNYLCPKCKKRIKFRFVKDVKTGWIKEITKVKW